MTSLVRCAALALLATACGTIPGLSQGALTSTLARTGQTASVLAADLGKCDALGKQEITFDEERVIGGTVALNWVQRGGGLLVDVPAVDEAQLRDAAGVRLAKTSPRNALSAYLNVVGRNLASRSSRPTLQWTFGVLDSPSINALSAPGGYVFVTRGLLRTLQNEAQLAGVLGHEIAHVTHKDAFQIYRQTKIDRCKSVAYAKAGGTQGADVLRLYGPGFVQQAIRAFDALGGGPLDLNAAANNALLTLFSDELVHRFGEAGLERGQELQADATGLELATAAGYGPRGFIAFVRALPANGRAFAHHPPPAERADAMTALVTPRKAAPLSVFAQDSARLPLLPFEGQLAAVE